MNEDYSELIKNFSEILKEKDIDINKILDRPQESICPETNTSESNETHTSSEFNLNFEDILKIKKILELLNNSQNTKQNNLLHSLKPFLPVNKKEKLEQLIKISSLLTALELFENKNILGIDLSSNTILIIILILIIL